MSMISQIIPSDAWSIPMGKPFPKENYPAEQGTYAALFPMTWCDYSTHPENPIHILLEQFSPIIPHNYFSSSLPLGNYTWHTHNPLKERVTVGLLFNL